MKQTRIESDSMGELAIPIDALYGAQTQRAINNFPISGQALPQAFIHALILIKQAAAQANSQLGLIPKKMTSAIITACQQLLNDPDFIRHFPVDVFQTGSGTSTNMNANEVIATLGTEIYGQQIHPNDHVNFGQSSNDVIPSCIHVSAVIGMNQRLFPALIYLIKVIKNKAQSVDHIVKTGRTHLMDAMPIRLSQALNGWAAQIEDNLLQLQNIQHGMLKIAQGGTAVGSGINAHPDFANEFSQQLNQLTGLRFKPADNFFSRIGSQDCAVALSGQLKTLAVSVTKICNDLRWMNSGPLAGLGEIQLEAHQPGSSIMPGKINPVVPEATLMVCAQVIGNDSAITIGGQAGNFELNVMLPMIANNLLSSLDLLSSSCTLLADKAIFSFKVNPDNLTKTLDKNPILVTALNPVIGYAQAAKIAKQAYAQNRSLLDVALENTDLDREQLKRLLDPARLTQGGLS